MSLRDGSGVLYVVATPIGNLEDITLRALRILKEVHVIAAENVERTRGLCHHYKIETRVISFNQHNWKRKAPQLLKALTSGHSVALVSDAGTPGVSDPGGILVSQALERGIKVVPVPGPSAVAAALSVSGLPSSGFIFLGFLPPRRGARKRELERWARQSLPLVIFEAPHRLVETLKEMAEVMPTRPVVLIREMTKIYEEIKRGRSDELLKKLGDGGIKGEITLVVAGKKDVPSSKQINGELASEIRRLVLEEGKGAKEVAELLAGGACIPYRQIYKLCLGVKKAAEKR